MIDNENLRIALLGAPTSGKTKIAQKFAEAIDLDFLMVDNPSSRIEQMGYDLGNDGDFRTTISMAMFQLEDEKKFAQEGGIISCGTVIQRLAHTGSAVQSLGDRSQQFPTIENRRNLLIENQLGHVLAFLMAEEFQYHFIFYLPLKSNTGLLVPESVDDERTYNNRVDTGIQQLLEAFFIPAIPLDVDGDPAEEMVNFVKESMDKLNAEETENKPEAPVEL